MKRFKNILVATDTRLDDHPIIDEAADIAFHNDAILKIVDVVPDFPWAIRMTLPDHEHIRDLMIQEKAQKLESLAEPIRERGIDVSVKVLTGKTSVEIIREVLRDKHDLVMRVAKGKESRARGFFGTTGMKLLHQCPCAVWLVTPDESPKFSHVLGCVDTSSGDDRDAELNDQVFELAKSISQYHDGRFSILHVWSIWNDQFLRGRMTEEEFQLLTETYRKKAESLFDEFLKRHGSSLQDDNTHLLRGEPTSWIPKFVVENDVDLVVMGTVARSGISGMIMGNTAEQILNQLTCSVLAIKPKDFVSPITL